MPSTLTPERALQEARTNAAHYLERARENRAHAAAAETSSGREGYNRATAHCVARADVWARRVAELSLSTEVEAA